MATKKITQATIKRLIKEGAASVKTQKPSDIPEFIEGIPTKKSRKDERTELVKGFVIFAELFYHTVQVSKNVSVNDFNIFDI